MTGAEIGFVVRADKDVIERQPAPKAVVHAIEFAAGLVATRQAGLVGSGDEQESSAFEIAQQRSNRLVYMEFLHGQGADLVLAFDSRHVQNPVPFDKYTLFHTSARARTSPSCLVAPKEGINPAF
jgi:hypothetical protein